MMEGPLESEIMSESDDFLDYSLLDEWIKSTNEFDDFHDDDIQEVDETTTKDELDQDGNETVTSKMQKLDNGSAVKVNTQTTTSTPSTSTKSKPLQDRLKNLINAPKLLQQHFNVGDFDKFSEVIHEICEDNVVIKTSVVNAEAVGCKNVCNVFMSAARSYPDLVLALKTIKFNRQYGVITSILYASGTRIFRDEYDHMYSSLEHSQTVDPALKEKKEQIENNGGNYRATGRVLWHFILNRNRKKVKKILVSQKVLTVDDSFA